VSTFIPLGRAPKSPEERQMLISEQVAHEERIANMGLSHVNKAVVDYLLSEKGYRAEDLEVEREFRIELGDEVFSVKSDIVLKVEGRIVLLVKCAMTSPDSWERYMVAMCRVACNEVIPFCLVTDGEYAGLIDVRSGDPVSNSFGHIPSRQEALRIVEDMASAPFAMEKAEKEKRILFAFAGLNCTSAKDNH
jgi:hypothetical protein